MQCENVAPQTWLFPAQTPTKSGGCCVDGTGPANLSIQPPTIALLFRKASGPGTAYSQQKNGLPL